MPALAITLLVVALWSVQGIGFVRRLMPSLREQPLVEWVLATWFGALTSLIALLELYYIVPAATIGQLAWPVTIMLAGSSIVMWVRSSHSRRRLDAASWGVVAISLVATLLVLRPLLGHPHLGFYFSNNGEFANYAAIGDAARFHDSATAVGGFGLHSREAIGAIPAAVVSQLTGRSLLWVIQPVAAAMAMLAFATLGILTRRVALAFDARWPTLIALGLIFAWAVMSASAQCFWTLSFVSQYLCVALWFGALAALVELPVAAERARILLLGLTIGALACIYPEMAVPSTALLVASELAMAPRRRTVARLAVTAVIAIIVANRLGLELVLGRTGMTAGGWNIYGDSRPVLGFFSAITGFTNPFSGPTSTHLVTVGPAAIVFVAALAFAAATIRKAPPSIRALSLLVILFALGVAGIFWIVARRGDGNNYVALKLLLGLGWLGYLGLAIMVASIARAKPVLGYVALAIMLVFWVDLSRGAYRFTKQLHQVRRTALYDEHDAASIRQTLDARPVYVAAGWFNTFIIGQFIAYDHDLVAADGRLSEREHQTFTPGSWILVLEDADLTKDPHLASSTRIPAWIGPHLLLLR